MAYIDGFVAAVPNANKEKFAEHAKQSWPVFQKLGAVAQWECWGDQVPGGEVTSFPLAVQAKEDETVIFSWVVWPDKETRETAWDRMRDDPQLMEDMGEMPFDGKRIIYGGFEPVLTAGSL